MGLFPYYVESFDVTSRRQHVGDFRRLKAASAAARHSLESPRCVLAVVKTVEGAMVYAVEPGREWIHDESHEDAASGVFRGSDGPDTGGVVVPMRR